MSPDLHPRFEEALAEELFQQLDNERLDEKFDEFMAENWPEIDPSSTLYDKITDLLCAQVMQRFGERLLAAAQEKMRHPLSNDPAQG